MKKLICYLLVYLLVQLIPFNSFALVVGYSLSAQGGVAVSYLVKQDFEGTGYDNGESWTEEITDGVINEDYATSPAPLVGSQSLLVDSNASTYVYSQTTFTGQSEAWVYGIFSVENSSASSIFALRDASSNLLCSIYNNNDGTVHVTHGSSISGTTAISVSTTYHFWVRYLKGTGSNGEADLYISTTSTKPGSPNASLTNGTGTADPALIRLYIKNNGVIIYDKIRVNDENIGSNPE